MEEAKVEGEKEEVAEERVAAAKERVAAAKERPWGAGQALAAEASPSQGLGWMRELASEFRSVDFVPVYCGKNGCME